MELSKDENVSSLSFGFYDILLLNFQFYEKNERKLTQWHCLIQSPNAHSAFIAMVGD